MQRKTDRTPDEGRGAIAVMHRYRFVLTRPLQFLPVIFGISVITFILVRLIPGDPARVILGTRATPTALANIRAQYGLDQPIWLQYFYFLKNLANGEMGKSILYKIDVLKLIADPHRADDRPSSYRSVVLSVPIAVPMAAIAARNAAGRRIMPCASSRPSASAFRPSGWA